MKKVNIRIGKIIENTIYILLIIPLAIITIRVSYQVIFLKDKIPDIFGYKLFFILDENMDETLNKGDLVITYDKNVNDIKENDVVAFRNGMNTVTIHKVHDIQEGNKTSLDNSERIFIMSVAQNETNDAKYVDGKKIEGLVVKRIPRLGAILYSISRPIAMLIISCVILGVGGIWIFIAGKIDEKEAKKLEQKQKETQKEDKKHSISV